MGSCWSLQVVIVNGKFVVLAEVAAWASRCCLLTWVSPSGCWIQLCGGGYLGQFLVRWKRGKKDTWIRVNPSNSPYDNLFCIEHFTQIHKSRISFFLQLKDFCTGTQPLFCLLSLLTSVLCPRSNGKVLQSARQRLSRFGYCFICLGIIKPRVSFSCQKCLMGFCVTASEN